MSVTIKEIAQKANVAISTVSYVLNNKSGAIKASEETRKKILRIAQELNYTPSIMAKGLRTGKSSMVGMMLPAIYSSFFPEILQGVEDVLNQNNYNMILCTYKNISEFQKKWKVLHSKHVDGIITFPVQEKNFITSYTEIKEKMPLVFTAGRIDELNIPFVYVPPSEIAIAGVKYLINQGHRNIGILGPRRGGFIETFIQEMKNYRDSKYFISADLINADTDAVVTEFIKMKKEFKGMSAIIAFNDEIAARIIYETKKMGLRVPEEFSVLGVDDLPICKIISPNITTIAQPRYEQGSIAAQMLLDIINKKHIQKEQELHPSLIERESCRKIGNMK